MATSGISAGNPLTKRRGPLSRSYSTARTKNKSAQWWYGGTTKFLRSFSSLPSWIAKQGNQLLVLPLTLNLLTGSIKLHPCLLQHGSDGATCPTHGHNGGDAGTNEEDEKKQKRVFYFWSCGSNLKHRIHSCLNNKAVHKDYAKYRNIFVGSNKLYEWRLGTMVD